MSHCGHGLGYDINYYINLMMAGLLTLANVFGSYLIVALVADTWKDIYKAFGGKRHGR